MIPNWSAIETSFLHQPYPQQLGELAAALARLESWCQKDASRELVPVLLSESLLYVNLLQQKSHINNIELSQLQKLLQGWEQDWLDICDRPIETASLSPVAATWSKRVLDMSGLLSTAVM
jgi:hypothetical protein